MRTRGWDPYQEMEALLREYERVRSSNPGGSTRGSDAAFLPGRAARQYPLINLSEDHDNVYVEALAPGIDPENINLTVVRNTLTIAGEKLSHAGIAPEAVHRSERATGKFIRNVELPVDVDSNKVSARYADGLLTITLPKAEAAKPRQIQVAVG